MQEKVISIVFFGGRKSQEVNVVRINHVTLLGNKPDSDVGH